eukprot:gene10463-19251_t
MPESEQHPRDKTAPEPITTRIPGNGGGDGAAADPPVVAGAPAADSTEFYDNKIQIKLIPIITINDVRPTTGNIITSPTRTNITQNSFVIKSILGNKGGRKLTKYHYNPSEVGELQAGAASIIDRSYAATSVYEISKT